MKNYYFLNYNTDKIALNSWKNDSTKEEELEPMRIQKKKVPHGIEELASVYELHLT